MAAGTFRNMERYHHCTPHEYSAVQRFAAAYLRSWLSANPCAGMLSPEGRCKTLDAAADGYVRAEAVGVFVLSSFAATERARGAHPSAWIVGAAVNQDGRSSSLTAPNGPAQQDVIRQALADARMPPAAVAALSMHGTGTPLGDPIEVGAAAAVLLQTQPASSSAAPLLLSASKSWMGHAEPASGGFCIYRYVPGMYIACSGLIVLVFVCSGTQTVHDFICGNAAQIQRVNVKKMRPRSYLCRHGWPPARRQAGVVPGGAAHHAPRGRQPQPAPHPGAGRGSWQRRQLGNAAPGGRLPLAAPRLRPGGGADGVRC